MSPLATRRSPIHIVVRSREEAAAAPLDARSFARDLGLDSVEQMRIATVVAELAMNIAKYASRGRVIMTAGDVDGRRCIDIEARDRGPGIECVETALRDHVSSGGTLGLGLPGVRRLVDGFEIESAVGDGTVVRARRWVTQP